MNTKSQLNQYKFKTSLKHLNCFDSVFVNIKEILRKWLGVSPSFPQYINYFDKYLPNIKTTPQQSQVLQTLASSSCLKRICNIYFLKHRVYTKSQ